MTRPTGHARPPKYSSKLVAATAIAGISLLWAATHGLYIIASGMRTISDWTYDDAYFYFVTAHHLATIGKSTFDGGLTLHSGYHFLWMAACTLDAMFFPHLDMSFLRSLLLLSLLISTIVGGAVLFALFKAQRTSGLLVLALMFTSYSGLNNSISAMEWPLVVAISAAFGALLFHIDRIRTVHAVVAAFGLGFLGSLARSDMGLFFGSFWLAYIALYLRGRQIAPAFFSIITASVIGAIGGLVAMGAINMALTGHLLQTSAHMKTLYALGGIKKSPIPAIWQFARALLYLPPLDIRHQGAKQAFVSVAEWSAITGAFLIAATSVTLATIAGTRQALNLYWRQATEAIRVLPQTWHLVILASLIGIIGYIIVYSFNASAVFGWYSANVTLFIFTLGIILAMAIEAITPFIVPTVLVAIIIALNIGAALTYGGNAPGEYPLVRAGERLREPQYKNLRAAGGDTGKIGYFAGGSVINTDGLVNDEIFPYVQQGRLYCYLLDRHISLTKSFGQAGLSNDAVRRKNGLSVHPLDAYAIATDIPTFYRVRFDVLQSYPECASGATGHGSGH